MVSVKGQRKTQGQPMKVRLNRDPTGTIKSSPAIETATICLISRKWARARIRIQRTRNAYNRNVFYKLRQDTTQAQRWHARGSSEARPSHNARPSPENLPSESQRYPLKANAKPVDMRQQ
jgi:hypothetical protein